MPRIHRDGIRMESRSTEVRTGQNWKHRWNERTVRIIGRLGADSLVVQSEGRANYPISESTLKRDYRLAD